MINCRRCGRLRDEALLVVSMEDEWQSAVFVNDSAEATANRETRALILRLLSVLVLLSVDGRSFSIDRMVDG